MPSQQSPLSEWNSQRYNDTDPHGPWACLLHSAEQVLRGDLVEGAFASITDRRVRRRLASELMLEEGELDEGWRRMFLCYSDTSSPEIPVKAFRSVGFPEPPSFATVYAGAIHPRFWSRYLQQYSPESTQGRNRLQAASAFSVLVHLAVHVAYSDERLPRVASAWRVIDAIDEGRPLIPALCEFLHLGKAEIRASRTMSAVDWYFDGAWPTIRRLLRIVVQLPICLRPQFSPHWSETLRTLPLLVVFARVARARLPQLLSKLPSIVAELEIVPDRSKAESRAMLRLLAKELRAREAHARTLRHVEHFWIERMDPDYRVRQRCPLVIMMTESSWSLRSIVSLEELSREGEEMAHCVARNYSRDLLSGVASFYTIRSADTAERLTMMVSRDWGVEFCKIEISGPRGETIRPSSLRAVLELLELLQPNAKIARLIVN